MFNLITNKLTARNTIKTNPSERTTGVKFFQNYNVLIKNIYSIAAVAHS